MMDNNIEKSKKMVGSAKHMLFSESYVHWLEWLVVPYFLFPIMSLPFRPDAMKLNLESLEGNILFLTIISVVYLFVLKSKNRFNFGDFKFLTVLRLFVVVIALAYQPQLFYALDAWGVVNYLWWVPLVWYYIIFMAITVNLLKPIDVLSNELVNVKDHVSENDFTYRISNPKLLKDSVFTIHAELINELMQYLDDYYQTVDSVLSVLSESTGELKEKYSLIINSSNDITNVIAALTEGANTETSLLNSLNEKFDVSAENLLRLSQTIEKNIQAVSEVAIQINILSLNAGIEASRAGDYGRGFTVVAENIRKLSVETNELLEKITSRIHDIFNSFRQQFQNMHEDLEGLAAISEENTASFEEVSASIDEVKQEMDELTKHVTILTDTVDYLNNLTKSS